MKTKKHLIKISLISLILIILMCMFKSSYAAPLVSVVAGGTLVVVLSEVLQVAVLAISTAINAVIAGVTGINALVTGEGAPILGIKSIVFNQCNITTASFFEGIGYKTNVFAQKIGEYYNIIRNLSIAILLFVLLYIGIRMVISTVAEEEAKYKKMLTNWLVSLVLVFVLHYIMILTFVVNDSLVNALFETTKKEFAGIDVTIAMDFLDATKLVAGGLQPIIGWPEVIIYTMFTVATLSFFFTYIKRVISLGFLIVIAPLITITYSIDKIGDNRSQALNTWLKEFMYTVLIQPFHCIIYIVFVNTSLKLVAGVDAPWSADGLGNSILAIACVLFMLKSEGIIKKIFGLEANSMEDTMKTGAIALGMATGLFKGAGKGTGKVPEMKRKTPNDAGVKTKANATGETAKAGASSATNAVSNTGTNNTSNSGANTATSTGSNSNASYSMEMDNAFTYQEEPLQIEKGGYFTGTDSMIVDYDPSLVENVPKQSVGDKIKGTMLKAGEGTVNVATSGFEKGLDSVGKFFERYSGETGAAGIAKGVAKFGLTNGAAVFAGIAGAGLGDGSNAISSAMAAKGAADGLYGIKESHDNQEQAIENEKVFAEARQDYIDWYRENVDEFATEEEIDIDIENLLEDDGQTSGVLSQARLNILDQLRQLKDTGEALGYKDGTMYVRDIIRDSRNGKYRNLEE